MSLLQLYPPGVTFGADPELFLMKVGAKRSTVVGSERIITAPIKVMRDAYEYGTVETDGVQVELHPKSAQCRQGFSNYIREAMKTLKSTVDQHPHLQVSFASLVRVPKREFIGLSERAKFLGCTPSFNAYGRETKEVNGLEYRIRTAAGHLHLGLPSIDNGHHKFSAGAPKIDPARLTRLLDITLGIPSVMIDKDPNQRERRKLYGKAGEYRLPSYGLEYRTLSNFWLQSYPLMSLVCAQARVAVNLAFLEVAKGYSSATYATKVAAELLTAVDPLLVEKAINKNDQALAFKIYDEVYKPIMKTVANPDGIYTTTYSDSVGGFEDFEYFCQRPLAEWLPQDVFAHWAIQPKAGWESYTTNTIRPMRMGSAAAEPIL